jgi:hypothetical protein
MPSRLAVLSILLVAGAAHATSSVPAKVAAKFAAADASCAVSARFVEARPERGHVVWVFERIASGSATRECAIESARFDVWIWEGSWSSLTGAAAYPLYVEEPAAGSELDLRLENRVVNARPKNERFAGWFLAAGAGSVKARTR